MENEAAIDFLVALLLMDGLRVDPFVIHSARNGDLHRRGLTPGAWLDWLTRVAFSRSVASPEHKIDPMVEWSGALALRETLAGLWERYRADYGNIVQSRTAMLKGLFSHQGPHSSLVGAGVLQDKKSYGLPTLRVCRVRYPVQVLHMATPDVAVLGDGFGAVVPAEFAHAIADAAEQQRVMHGRYQAD